MDKFCGNCVHFIDGGDWSLCCDIEHPTDLEKAMGIFSFLGYLCYEDTPACDMFKERLDNHN